MKLWRELMMCLLLHGLSAHVLAGEGMVDWPQGWVSEALPQAGAGAPQRERASRMNAAGDPQLVVEITRSPLQPGHVVNLQGVLLEMRKAVQQNFLREGFQSVCTHVRDSRLADVPAAETTCTVTQNGVHVMTQTLVTAASQDQAWSMTYAGSVEGFEQGKEDVQRIRESVRLRAKQ